MSRRGLKIAGLVLGGTAVATLVATVAAAHLSRIYHSRRPTGAPTADLPNHATPVSCDPWFTASAEELDLLRLMENHGWPVHHRNALVGLGSTTEDGVHALLQIGGDEMRLQYADAATADEFVIATYRGLPVYGPAAGPNPRYMDVLPAIVDGTATTKPTG